MSIKKEKIFLSIFLVFAITGAMYLSCKGYVCFKRIKAYSAVMQKRKAAWAALRQALDTEVSRFKGTAGIVIKDLRANWEMAINDDELFPSASLAKVPVMVSCFQAESQGKITLYDKVKLTESAKVTGSGKLKYMASGSVFTIERLIELMICESDNTATNMLINILGYEYINGYSKVCGLKHTSLVRKMMDFRQRKSGVENYTTPVDMACILEKIYRQNLISPAVSERCLGMLKRQKSHDRIPAGLPSGVIAAHKTGLEHMVCHDAGIVFTPKGDFLVCVLTKGVPHSRTSKKFISKIAFFAYNYMVNVP